MAVGRRKRGEQGTLWIATAGLPQSGGHPFYQQVNRILDGEGFDRFVEERCRTFYADKMGRPSLAPTMYFRMLMIGYFEGIVSERVLGEVVADKGYHSNAVLKDHGQREIRTYIAEPDRGQRNWKGTTEEETAEKSAARDGCMAIVAGFVASVGSD